MILVRDLALALTLPLLACLAWRDLATRIIPNWICVVLAAAGVIVRALHGLEALAISVGMAALLLLAFLPIHARGMLGGGDIKLLAALALGLPAWGTYQLMVATTLAGGVLVLVHLALRCLPAPAHCPPGAAGPRRVWTIERWRPRRNGSLPYGVAIACGGAWAILSGWGA